MSPRQAGLIGISRWLYCIVQSEALNYNGSLNSAFRALHIHGRVQIFSEHASELCVIAAASSMVKTGKPMSNCGMRAYEKNENTKSHTVN